MTLSDNLIGHPHDIVIFHNATSLLICNLLLLNLIFFLLDFIIKYIHHLV